jgi:hypothetical protein
MVLEDLRFSNYKKIKEDQKFKIIRESVETGFTVAQALGLGTTWIGIAPLA